MNATTQEQNDQQRWWRCWRRSGRLSLSPIRIGSSRVGGGGRPAGSGEGDHRRRAERAPFYEVNFLGAPNGSAMAPSAALRDHSVPTDLLAGGDDPRSSGGAAAGCRRPNLVRCFLQAEPAHMLPRLSGVPIVISRARRVPGDV